jgi:hypothetical protein
MSGAEMNRKKSLIRGGAVLAVALAAGHLVQTMNSGRVAEAPAQPKQIEQVSAGAKAAPPVSDPVLPSTASLGGAGTAPATPDPAAPGLTVTEVAPAPSDAILPAALPEPVPPLAEPILPALPSKDTGAEAEPPVDMAAVKDAPEAAAPDAMPVATKDCAVDLALSPAPQATIGVRLTAPCRAGERVVLRHAGLVVAEEIPASGTLDLDLPALKASGEVSALFPDAEVARAAVAIPDAGAVKRFAVQWMADDAFQLHAMENGADYGQPGHVSADTPVSANGGYMMALGNPTLDLPMMAQVYTWPADAAVVADVVIESAVTETTCGRELLGETISVQAGTVTVKDLTLAMPGCDAVGDILVLKNPGQDVTLAATN